MRKFTIEKRAEGWVAVGVRGNVISGPHAEEWMASLYGTHAACAPTLFKSLGFKKAETGSNYRAWQARPFSGVRAFMCKHPQTDWTVIATVDGEDIRREFKTRDAACKWVNGFGDDIKTTRNILNREHGDIEIARRDLGGCTDPGTELYHCM